MSKTTTTVTVSMKMVALYARHEAICLDAKDTAGFRYWRDLRNKAEAEIK
jgi:hypothetical protein